MRPELWLTDERRRKAQSFEAGETIYVQGHGFRPLTLHRIELLETGAKPVELARLMSDRHGSIPATAVLPFFGLSEGKGFRTVQEAEKSVGGRSFIVRTEDAEARFAVPSIGRRPIVHPCDARGHPITGFTLGETDLQVALHRFPLGCVRVYAVPRQYDWHAGDAISVARDVADRAITATVKIQSDGMSVVRLLSKEQVAHGSYQFIARHFVPGWFSADDERLLDDDVLSNRRFASLVVRLPAHLSHWIGNGVVLTPEIAGRPLPHRPYFQFLNNFPLGTDVYAALDPGALPAGIVTTKAAIYVIAHKAAADWNVSNALTDISGPGMTPNVKIVPIVPGCVNWNETLVWPNPQVPGKYDIVIDFGNNSADPALFATDGKLDSPPDMIDGYVRAGFLVTQDPSLSGPYAGQIGRHEYNNGTVQVPSTDTGPFPTDSLPLIAVVRYPAQFSGDDAPFAAGAFPLVVVMHGNSGMSTSYLGYNYLLDHLASHGFVAVSIHAPVGVGIETRARAILQHLTILSQSNSNPGLFQGHIDLTRIAIAGHSRGGEAVVRAARINTAEGLGWNIRAGASIAPTDYHHYGDPGIPLLVIYGSNDGDVSGAWPDRTCFNIYDEAARPRSFVFVYGATHDRFNSEWTTIEGQVELQLDIAPSDLPKLISETAHHNVAKAYVTAFYRTYVLGNSEQVEYFSSGLRPFLVNSLTIHTSHQDVSPLVLDNFSQNNPALNSLGGAVAVSNVPPASEGALHTLDTHSPHVTTGGGVVWTTTLGKYLSAIPPVHKDVSQFTALTFRVTQKYGSLQNAPNVVQDFDVRLKDNAGHSRAIRVSTFTDIPYPYERGFATRIKSAMKSVRIPLISYTIANLGADTVDLTDLDSVSFEFDAKATGEVGITDIEFV